MVGTRSESPSTRRNISRSDAKIEGYLEIEKGANIIGFIFKYNQDRYSEKFTTSFPRPYLSSRKSGKRGYSNIKNNVSDAVVITGGCCVDDVLCAKTYCFLECHFVFISFKGKSL